MKDCLSIYAQQNQLGVDELFSQDELKRVTPSELLTSGFFTNLPIRKHEIDFLIGKVEHACRSVK